MDDVTCAALKCDEPGVLVADVPLCGRHQQHLHDVLDASTIAMLALLPKPLIPVRPGTLERFAAKVRLGDDACRIRWVNPDRVTGYGRFLLNGKDRGAHVASHLMFVGPVADGLFVDHVRDRGCTHRDCVWWEHLEAVTPSVNSRRGNAGAWQREKTHCKNGHEFTPDNIYWIGIYKDMRACKACAKETGSARYRRTVNPNPDPRAGGLKAGPIRAAQQRAKTHCPQGHEYTPDNIYWVGPNKDFRKCKTCARASQDAYRARMKLEDPAGFQERGRQANSRSRQRKHEREATPPS